jgi:hypothetical protein
MADTGGFIPVLPEQNKAACRGQRILSGMKTTASVISEIQTVFSFQIPVLRRGKCAFAPGNASCVSNGLPFCEFCENVNNFSGKFLPATAICEKKLSSSALTGSRPRRKIVPVLSAA